MLNRVADIIAGQVEEITRAWVADLRQTPATEIHNTLLSYQIVSGVKAMLGALAQTIRERQAPDAASARLLATLTDDPAQVVPESLLSTTPALPASGRYPALPGPLDQVRRQARLQGRTRQQQGYAIHEVVHEYIALRHEIFAALNAAAPAGDPLPLALAAYLDRLLDEALVQTMQSYHEAVIADLQHRAVRDLMSGLYNHEYFQDRLQEEVRRASRQGTALSLAMIDVDRLKEVNDTYGHAAGDQLLLAVAEALRSQARETDLVCRYGGDEFTIILPNTNYSQAENLVERIQATLAEPLILRGALLALGQDEPADEPDPLPSIRIAVSIGIASYPADARNAETLIAQADAVMYRTKLAGRGRRVS